MPGQNDIHEFGKFLLDRIEKDVDSSIFKLGQKTCIECTGVEFNSYTYQETTEFFLQVKGCKNLKESLDNSFQKERLAGENKYEAEGSKGKQEADITTKIFKFPEVLTLNLYRSSFVDGSTTKIEDSLDFNETLDLKSYCDEDNANATYRLYSVIIHTGEAESGHYYIYVRPELKSYSEGEDGWLCINDHEVNKCEFGKVMEEGKFGAYCLHYIRSDCLEEVLGRPATLEDSDLPPNWEDRPQNNVPVYNADHSEQLVEVTKSPSNSPAKYGWRRSGQIASC